MDIAQTSAAAAPSAPTQTSTQGKPALSSDFETFLKMLTVQMQNQDPLNPIDSTDYAVQLATFSSVEQQVQTNDLLTSLSAALTGGGLGALGQWVGMEVRGSDKAAYDGDPIDLSLPKHEDADRRILVVTDEGGTSVARFDLSLSDKEGQWDGTLTNGAPATDGNYGFRVEFYEDGKLIDSQPAETYARVDEARIENGETVLILEGGLQHSASAVTALRKPTPSPI